MTAMERGIQAIVFILLLIGLFIVTGWASYHIEDIVLKIAGIAISWAVILLVLYVIFQKLGWDWWNN
jgi:hypothetical protein